MNDTAVNEIMERIKALPAVEQSRLKALLERILAEVPVDSSIVELDRKLIAAGLMSHLPDANPDPVQFGRWRPIHVEGLPVSRTIIEERR